MSKVKDELNNQLKTEDYKEDAQACLKIYDKLLEISEGHVWDSQWQVLVSVQYVGKYPNTTKIRKPTKIGKIFLNGMTTDE